MVKGIFFDVWGTLFLYGDMSVELSEWLAVFHRCLQRHGVAIDQRAFREYWHSRLSKAEMPAVDDGLTIFERRIKTAGHDCGVEIASADIRQIANELLPVWDKYISLDPACIPLLENLKNRGVVLGLISNFDHPPYVRALLRQSRLEEFFSAIVISGETHTKKPDPDIFRLALRMAVLEASDSIHVGDSEEDILGANSAGLISVLIDRVGLGRRWGQSHTVKSLDEIRGMI